MCKYTHADFTRAAERLEKANSAGTAATVRKFLKDFNSNVKDRKRTSKIISLCKGVLDTRPTA